LCFAGLLTGLGRFGAPIKPSRLRFLDRTPRWGLNAVYPCDIKYEQWYEQYLVRQ